MNSHKSVTNTNSHNSVTRWWSRSKFGRLEPEPEPKIYLAPEPDIWVPVPQIWFVGQARDTNNVFSDFLDQIILGREPKTARFWSRSQKI